MLLCNIFRLEANGKKLSLVVLIMLFSSSFHKKQLMVVPRKFFFGLLTGYISRPEDTRLMQNLSIKIIMYVACIK